MTVVGDTLKRDPHTTLRVRAVLHRVHASACGPRGFTLIEVLVALTLSGVVVLLAHRIFSGVADGAARLVDARTALDREMNARRWLAEAFGSLQVGTEGASFAGRMDRIEFTTAQRVPEGWLTPTPVTIGQVSDSLVASLDGNRLALTGGVRTIRFDYLLEPGANAIWVREWISPVSAPLAVRMRVERGEKVDTLLLLVGPRG